jgi:hypothetical protein
MKSAWQKLITRDEIGGKKLDEGWQKTLKDQGMGLRFESGKVFIDNFGNLTTSEMADRLSDVLGISKTLA